ncbi:Gfo/Idh/MocA family protein [Nesterenkonia sandarakina]|uniref:Putative dehydrogenase n=1 Tax=Nesterenkonia sandarakina TaxID=272918 RepID=A0A7Z0J2V7_9MICC|nr:Gfo/Idh/MocA family oxidoreductase [Nesterenkonia sandarakina]NYJ16326.1 putative dehydrogenase [Nesterenkonia sandarakina]
MSAATESQDRSQDGSQRRLNVGLIGAGNISGQYLQTLNRLEDLNLVGVADLDLDRARQVAEAGGAQGMSVEELLASPEVEAVINLTIPRAHAETSLAAIAAGKGVYVEKPFAATVAQGQQMLAAAETAGVVMGSAPDTVLGTGVQTARAAVDAGQIGAPISAVATMVTAGHESWHPNPDFYYQPGGGPLLDMGPYYVTSLITLLGPVASVIGASSALRTEREIGSGPRAGEKLPVSTPSHITGALIHESGAISTLVMSFDGTASQAPPIEVHGTEGSMAVPDPNHFAGEVLLARDRTGWQPVETAGGYVQAGRGYGLADLLWSGAFDGDPTLGRAQGALGLHVLEVMAGVLTAAETGASVAISSRADRPSAVPLDPR